MRLLVAGGGTGGHVLAGIAVADEWCSRCGSDSNTPPVLFVGAEGGIEERLVPKAGYSLQLLRVGSLNRVSWKKKLKTLFQLPLSFIRSMGILLRFKPNVVLGVGGYSSGPLVMTAWILRTFGLVKTKIAILEQNSIPGLTNRILGRFSDFIFAAFPGTEEKFSRRKVVITGNPVRSSMKPLPPPKDDPFTVFIFGGSQGAIGINTLVLEALPHLAKFPDLKQRLKLIHQTGEKDFDRVVSGYQKLGVPENLRRVEKFIYDMPSVYAEASLLICRAGSSTLAEVAAVGRAAVLIPLPTASDNHQEKNARVFSEVGASCLLLQPNSSGEDLIKLIHEFMNHSEQLRKMEKAVLQFYRPKAAEEIVIALSSDKGRI